MEKYVLPMLPQSTARWLTNILTRQQTQADNNDELVTTMKNSRYSQNQRKNLQRSNHQITRLHFRRSKRILHYTSTNLQQMLYSSKLLNQKWRAKKLTLRIAFIKVYYYSIAGNLVEMVSVSSFASKFHPCFLSSCPRTLVLQHLFC